MKNIFLISTLVMAIGTSFAGEKTTELNGNTSSFCVDNIGGLWTLRPEKGSEIDVFSSSRLCDAERRIKGFNEEVVLIELPNGKFQIKAIQSSFAGIQSVLTDMEFEPLSEKNQKYLEGMKESHYKKIAEELKKLSDNQ